MQEHVTTERQLPIAFTASGSEYFRIWIVNLLLTVVTLGLYLPFAKARRLRYFYANTQVDGHALGFHGDPWMMFRGHLVVMGFGLAYFLSAQFLPLLSLALMLGFVAVWPLLWRSSLMFRLRNTSWRGLRFDFTGSKRGAYLVFLPWLGLFLGAMLLGFLAAVLMPQLGERKPSGLMVFVLVLGFYALAFWLGAVTLSWMKRYQHGGYRFAQQQGDLRLSSGAVMRLFLKVLGLVLLGLLALLLLGLLLGGVGAIGGESAAAVMAVLMLPLAIAIYLAMVIGIGPFFIARLQNLVWGGTRSQALQFQSRLSARSLAWLSFKNLLLMIITLGLYRPFAVVATTRMRLQAVSVDLQGEMDAWLAEAQQPVGALGEMGGDFFGFDVGL